MSGATKLDGTSVYDSDSGGITVDEVDGIIIPFDLASGDSVTLTVEGSAEGSTPRIWVSDGAYTAASVIQNPMVFGTEYTITATAAANRIQVKAQSGGGKFSSLGITRVSVVKPLTVNDMPPVLYSPKDIPVSGIKVGAGTGVYDESSGIVRIEDTGSSEYYFNLPEEIAAGETVVVTVDGTWNGTYGFRFWIGDGVNSRSVVSVFNAANLPKGEFHKVMEFTATDTCKMLTLKQIATWSGGGPIDGFTLSNISITKKPAPRPAS